MVPMSTVAKRPRSMAYSTLFLGRPPEEVIYSLLLHLSKRTIHRLTIDGGAGMQIQDDLFQKAHALLGYRMYPWTRPVT